MDGLLHIGCMMVALLTIFILIGGAGEMGGT
jgi:hypothetical protein